MFIFLLKQGVIFMNLIRNKIIEKKFINIKDYVHNLLIEQKLFYLKREKSGDKKLNIEKDGVSE